MTGTIPTLRTERLRLRAFEGSDADAMLAILAEPDVLRYFPPGPVLDRDRVARNLERVLAHWREHGFGLWAVERLAVGELLGRCGLQVIPETGETEIDYILGKPYWGRGYATEAAKRSIGFGLQGLGLSEIVGIVHPDNAASRRVLEKLGMSMVERTQYFGIDVCRYVLRASAG